MSLFSNHTGGWVRNATLGTALSGLLFSGCTTHYRESIAAYRSAEPSPFYQRTLEWADSAIEAPEETEALVPADPVEDETDVLKPPETTNRPAAVAARILGVTPETFTSMLSSLEKDDHRDKALAGTLDWNTLLLVVTRDNPGVAGARNTWEATLKQYSQAEYLEGLLQEYKMFTRYLNVGAGSPLQKDMNQRFFPYPSTITFRGEMIREQVRLAELAWERVLRDTLVEAGTAYFDYVFQYLGAATVQENVSLLEDLINVVQDRYSTGLATQPDILRIQAELERQRKLQLDFQARQRSLAAKLNALLGRPGGASLGRPAGKMLNSPSNSADQLAAIALEHRQEVLAQQARVARTEIAIRMGEVMNRPPFSQGYSTLDRGMMSEAATGTPGTAPFAAQPDTAQARPAYAQAEAYLSETRERLAAERQSLAQVQLDTQAMARSLLEQAGIADRQTVLVRDVVLPLNQSTYEITLSKYKVGSMTFLDLLDAERALIESRLELDESLRNRNQAILSIISVRGFHDKLIQ